MDEIELSKIQNLTVKTVTTVGTVILYGTGVNLAITFTEYHNPIFATTVILSFISPSLLHTSTKYIFKKHNQKNNEKQLKKSKGDE